MPGRNKIGQTIGLAVGEKDRTDAGSESRSLCHGDIILDSKTVQIKLRTVNIPSGVCAPRNQKRRWVEGKRGTRVSRHESNKQVEQNVSIVASPESKSALM